MQYTHSPDAQPFGDTVPRLKDSVELFTSPDGTIHLLPATHATDFAITDPIEAHHRTFSLLTEGRTASEICRLVNQETGIDETAVASFLRDLAAAGLLHNITPIASEIPPDELERYDRQLRYFAELVPYETKPVEIQHRLRRARVGILGLGGIGSWTALALAAAGVGTLRICDGDTVDHSNLNRQVLYTNDDIGHPKSTAAASALRRFNPLVSVETSDQMVIDEPSAAAFSADCDLVIEAADTPVGVLSHLLNDVCLSAAIPHVIMSQYPPLVRVGPTFVPGSTGCFQCYESVASDEFEHYELLSRHRTERGAQGAAFGPICGIVGSLVANEVVNLLTGVVSPATIGAAYTLDTRTLEVTHETLHIAPNCSACQRN